MVQAFFGLGSYTDFFIGCLLCSCYFDLYKIVPAYTPAPAGPSLLKFFDQDVALCSHFVRLTLHQAHTPSGSV